MKPKYLPYKMKEDKPVYEYLIVMLNIEMGNLYVDDKYYTKKEMKKTPFSELIIKSTKRIRK